MGQFIDFAYVKTHADFHSVLQHYQIMTKGEGDEIRCLCPFHDDEHPSMSVNVDKKVFTCHADSCGEKGNILEFVDLMEDEPGLRKAAEVLAGICKIEVAKPKRKPRKANGGSRGKRKKRLDNETRKTAQEAFDGDGPVFDDEIDDGQRQPPKPLGFQLNLDPSHVYGLKRALSASAINRFEMGFCNRGIMKDRWCVPIHNAVGELVAYCGRWTGRTQPKNEPRYKLPKGFDKSRVLFNLHRVLASEWNQVVVVEGIFDAIRLHELGAPVVALLGSSISEEQVRLIRVHFVSACVMLDGGADEARTKVVDRLAKEILVQSLVLPDGEDPESVDEDLIKEKIPGPVLG